MSANLNKREISKSFADWAMGPSGIFGGNPEGKIWFCGIEFGGDEIEFRFDLGKYNYENCILPYWDSEFKKHWKNEYTSWQFQQKQAKVVCNILDSNLYWRDYLRDNLFSENGDTFSLNLFPLNFKNVDPSHWTKEHFINIGFSSKVEYISWCIQNRFPSLKELVNKHKPSVLICAGSTYKDYFSIAFLDNASDKFEKRTFESFDINKNKKIEWTKINNGNTLLIITPFLGQGGLMSDQSLADLAKLITSKWQG